MSDTVEHIASYRAAAAKLGEALADTPRQAHPIRTLANTLASCGIGLQGEEAPALWSNEPGWIWMAQAVRLRLLVEAELLEQESDPGYSDAELGALVRTWREGVNRGEE